MNCRNIKKNFLLYIEGALPEGHSSAIRGHISECQTCNSLISRGSEIFHTLEADRLAFDDPYFYTRVISRIEKKQTPVSLPLFTLRPLVLAFAVILPIVAGVWLGYSSHQKQSLDVVGKNLANEMSTLLTLPGYASLEDYTEPSNE